MKKKIRKWLLRFTATAVLIVGLLLLIILHPGISYAGKTHYKHFTIFHQHKLDPHLLPLLDEANRCLAKSDFFQQALALDICLNDGALYPSLIATIREPAFAWGFYNKVVLQGKLHCADNTLELNGYTWNLTQLLTHEMTHCLQFSKLGLFHANPFAGIPEWKWEGYAEYIARQAPEQLDLRKNIARWRQSDKKQWAVYFADNSIAPRDYYRYWMLVQYCLDIKKMNYTALLADNTSENEIAEEMNRWYESSMAMQTLPKLNERQ